MSKLLENATNVLLVITCAAILAVLGRQTWGTKPERPVIQAGQRLEIPGVKFTEGRKTLVMALQTGCHFCTESAPFYREILKAFEGKQNVEALGAFPQPEPDARKYLREHGLSLDKVVEVKPGTLKIGGTPTLLLISHKGIVERVWLGKLPPKVEREVLAASLAETVAVAR
jgi:hypothetical protein